MGATDQDYKMPSVQSSALAPAGTNNAVTPVELLNMAVQQGADLDRLEKLMELQERWEINEAKKAYHHAIAAFKTESIEIVKNKRVSFGSKAGKTEYSHATLDHVLEVTIPLLSKHGLSHRWDVKQDNQQIAVTCILTHCSGHSESITLSELPDDSGSKNRIQRTASTISYLERYTFLAITGLAAKGHDDDGQSAGPREGFAEGLAYGMTCYRLKETIESIKSFIADGDIFAAVEAWQELNQEDMKALWRAPTKGGIFTTAERKTMKSDEWAEAARAMIAQKEPQK